MNSERHVYRLKWWSLAGYLLLGLLLSGAGLTLIAIVILNGGWPDGFGLGAIAAMVLCPCLGYLFLAWALRSRVILDGDLLTVRNAIGTDSTLIGEIVGYRIVRDSRLSYWSLKLHNGGRILIERTYSMDDYFHDFISGLKLLEEEDEQA